MNHRILVPVLAAAMTLAGIPALAQTNYVDLALGSPYATDFNADDGGWSANEPPAAYRPDLGSSWAWGAPTSGPGFAASGSNVWATNPAGTYGAYECGAILSPPIDLTGATTASVSFQHWIHSVQSSFGSKLISDGGAFFVTADGGDTLTLVAPSATNGPLSTYAGRCMDGASSGTIQGIGGPSSSTPPAAAYAPISADLTPFVGQVVQFAIAFGTDCCTHRAGWYVDDFAVTIDGVTTVEDFEASDGGFTVVSTYSKIEPQGWSHGVPAAGGPGSDSPMWATNIDGNYGHGECAILESPPIQLGPAGDAGAGVLRATLSWNHWFRSNSVYAAAVVQVGTLDENGERQYTRVTPVGGYPSDATGTYQDQLHACLGADSAEGAYSGTHDAVGAALKAQQVDLSAYAGQDVTIRFAFASAWSHFNPTVYAGWYVDDVYVDLALVVEGPEPDQVVEDLLDQTPGVGSTTPPGWSYGGTGSSWDYGLVSYGPAGELALATNLHGNHTEDECSWAETPAIPGALLATDPTLAFDTWHNQYYSTFSNTAWNGGALFVSRDLGATWEYVADAPYTNAAWFSGMRACFQSIDPAAPSSGGSFSGDHREWEHVEVDLSAYADADTVKIRFVQGSGIGIERDGWYLRNVEIAGVRLA